MQRTLKLLEEFKNEELIKDFILVGGTALALQIHHRESFDLDFIHIKQINKEQDSLNKIQINRIMDKLRLNGHDVIRMPYDDAVYLEFADAGEDISNLQQDYNIDKIKVTFFVPPDIKNEQILENCKPTADKYLKIADIETIARQKIILLIERNKIRDYFDVYFLLKNKHIPESMFIEELKNRSYMNTLLTKIDHIDKFKDDEGLRTLNAANTNPETIKNYLKNTIARYIQNATRENTITSDNKPIAFSNDLKKSQELQKYSSIYQTSGLDAAVLEIKNDKKDTNWIMFYREKLFPDVQRSELETSVNKLDKDKGFGR